MARHQAAADKTAHAKQLADALIAITRIHHEEFPLATPPVAPPPPAPDEARIRVTHSKAAKKQTNFFARSARKVALAAAEDAANAEIAAEMQRGRAEQTLFQAELDAWWAALERCAPEAVLGTLAAAFEDNEAAAAAVGVEGTEVSLVVLVPPESAIPDRKPTTTQAGNLSLKKLTKTETADFYKLLVTGHMLVTLREAFAVVPRLTAARIVAIRASERDAYGVLTPEVLMAGLCQRIDLEGVRWKEADSTRIFNDATTEKVVLQKGAIGALQPVPLASEPELQALLGAVDLDELAAT